jgi:hypothetical protein
MRQNNQNNQNNQNKKNYSMTNCTKTGIKIRTSDNDYRADPFANVDPFKYRSQEPEQFEVQYSQSQCEALDLNIDNYSREELYKLFGFNKTAILTEDNMRSAKKIVLKTHPDKSRLENKYFIFFSSAYKKLYEIYQFQNKTNSKKTTDNSEYFDTQNELILDKMFDMKKDLKDSNNFNKWFNQQFEKHRIDDPVEHGYGNWLKSDEDIVYTPQNINKDTLGREMDKRKKEVQQLTPYTGVGSSFGVSSVGGAALMEYNSNFSSGSLFNGGGNVGYTDLRQAYVESVIPVTEDDFNKMQKFKSVNEYKHHRDNADLTPLSKEEAMRQLFNQEKKANEDSAALAFYYAQQSEKAKNNNNEFWSGLKQLTNW